MDNFEKLYQYLNYFETLTEDKACQWMGGEKQGDGVFIMAYPEYDEPLKAFVKETYESDLLAPNYLEVMENSGLHSHEDTVNALKKSDLQQTQAILTFYIRQERFSEGTWASAVRNKIFYKVIKRLIELDD
jgi:hypothetical protein